MERKYNLKKIHNSPIFLLAAILLSILILGEGLYQTEKNFCIDRGKVLRRYLSVSSQDHCYTFYQYLDMLEKEESEEQKKPFKFTFLEERELFKEFKESQ